MPRRKATSTKACQTDYVFLGEKEVENIVNHRTGWLEDELKRLQELIERLQEEIGQLKTSTEKTVCDLDSLNNLQQATEVLVEQLDGRLDSIEEDVEQKIAIINSRFETKVNHQEMQGKLDDIEQQTKIKNLRFFGLEEQEGEDPIRKVIDFVQEQMSIEIKPNEIEANRVGALHPMNTKPRDILVKFDCGFLRNAIYKKKIILRRLNQQVFINEDLTAKRSHLFFEARKMRKQQKLFGVWTQAGNVLVKVNPESNPKQVSNIEEIKSLINDNSSNESDTDIEMSSTDDAL